MPAPWPLEPGLTYLNHGTVGVTPLAVLEAQRTIRDEIERWSRVVKEQNIKVD